MSQPCQQHQPADGTCRRSRGRWADGCLRYCDEPATRVVGVGCEAELQTALADLPGHWDLVAADLTPGRGAQGARVSGATPAPPSPIDQGAQALLDSISWWVTLYEDEVRARARLSPRATAGRRPVWLAGQLAGPRLPDGAFLSRAARAEREWQAATRPSPVAASCRLLSAHLPVLLAIPEGTTIWDADREAWVDTSGLDAAERLLWLHSRTRARLGLVRAKIRHPDVPCRKCGAYAITHDDGQETRGCEVCGEQYAAQDWDTYLGWLGRYTEPLRREQARDLARERRLARQ